MKNKKQLLNKLHAKKHEIVAAGKAVFKCMALVETLEPVVNGYKRRILADMKAHIDKEWINKGMKDEVVLDPKHAYLLSETDFAEYLDHCDFEMEKAHLKVEEKGQCPLLVAEHYLVKAKHLLIEVMEPITGIKHEDLFRHGLKDYDKYIDLTLRMVAGLMKEREA